MDGRLFTLPPYRYEMERRTGGDHPGLRATVLPRSIMTSRRWLVPLNAGGPARLSPTQYRSRSPSRRRRKSATAFATGEARVTSPPPSGASGLNCSTRARDLFPHTPRTVLPGRSDGVAFRANLRLVDIITTRGD